MVLLLAARQWPLIRFEPYNPLNFFLVTHLAHPYHRTQIKLSPAPITRRLPPSLFTAHLPSKPGLVPARQGVPVPTFANTTTPPTLTMIKHKLVFLGDQSVGKTSLLSRFMYDKFDTQYKATVGIDFMSKTMYLPDRTIRLQLWDTAGQERFRTLVPSYIRDSNVAVVVYDVTDAKTFEAASKWIEDVQAERQGQALIVLVGNKCDLQNERVVTKEEGEAKAQEVGAIFRETSAKQGYNVKPLFKKIATELAGMEIPAGADKQQPEVVDVSVEPSQEQASCAC